MGVVWGYRGAWGLCGATGEHAQREMDKTQTENSHTVTLSTKFTDVFQYNITKKVNIKHFPLKIV
jgi:hypothetical protein